MYFRIRVRIVSVSVSVSVLHYEARTLFLNGVSGHMTRHL